MPAWRCQTSTQSHYLSQALLGFPYILWHREGHPKRFNSIVTGVSQRPATDYWHGSGQWEGWGKQGHIAKFDDLLTFWRINLEATSIENWIMIPHWLIYSSVCCSNCWKNWYTCKIDHNRLSYRHTINIRQIHPKLQEQDILSFILLWEANPSKWGIPTYQLPIKHIQKPEEHMSQIWVCF